jgi:asparagine synthase (glutamine-hydrolysing)
MNGYVCIRSTGEMSPETIERYRRQLHRCCSGVGSPTPQIATLQEGRFIALYTIDGDGLRPSVARCGPLVGIGDVRLDNREEVRRWAADTLPDADTPSDLLLVVAALLARGDACISQLVGDFAFVIWNTHIERLLAARDACGVRQLYFQEDRGDLRLGSRSSAIANATLYDDVWAAEYLLGGYTSEGRTPFAGCRHVLPGTYLSSFAGRLREHIYWSAADYVAQPARVLEERSTVDEYLFLFAEGVRNRIDGERTTWAQVSGGLDSSSIVCIAAALCDSAGVPELGGTLSFVDTLGDGDETYYSDAVVERFSLRNEKLVDYWLWQEDGHPPPIEDTPTILYPFWARDREVARLVRSAGGKVLLSGRGGDECLTGDPASAADLLRSGHFRKAVRNLMDTSIAQRTSVWPLAWEHLVLPLLPRRLRNSWAPARTNLPGWLNRDFVRRTAAAQRVRERRATAHASDGHYAAVVAERYRLLGALPIPSATEDGIEMRHPFLYRPLVEMVLGLPSHFLTRAGHEKWVLREALRNVLPERVRTRRGKGGPDARVLWSLSREEARITSMLRDPVISQLGWVERRGLIRSYEQAKSGHGPDRLMVQTALTLETWLRVQSGRW